jgi:hypothetical protein
MKIRTPIAVAGAAIILGSTVALTVPALASAGTSAPAARQTLRFTSMTVNVVPFAKTAEALQDTDVNSAGRPIGFDDLYLTFTSSTAGVGDVAFVVRGGILYGMVTTSNGGRTFSGKVTGGTAALRRATGTISARAVSTHKTAVQITYTT